MRVSMRVYRCCDCSIASAEGDAEPDDDKTVTDDNGKTVKADDNGKAERLQLTPEQNAIISVSSQLAHKHSHTVTVTQSHTVTHTVT